MLAAIWCVACALVGQQNRNPVRLESNILVGVLCTFGNFYVLRRHVQSIREGREELRDLNSCLVEENRRSEYALSRVADMYEGFALMAMTDAERVLGGTCHLDCGECIARGLRPRYGATKNR